MATVTILRRVCRLPTTSRSVVDGPPPPPFVLVSASCTGERLKRNRKRSGDDLDLDEDKSVLDVGPVKCPRTDKNPELSWYKSNIRKRSIEELYFHGYVEVPRKRRRVYFATWEIQATFRAVLKDFLYKQWVNSLPDNDDSSTYEPELKDVIATGDGETENASTAEIYSDSDSDSDGDSDDGYDFYADIQTDPYLKGLRRRNKQGNHEDDNEVDEENNKYLNLNDPVQIADYFAWCEREAAVVAEPVAAPVDSGVAPQDDDYSMEVDSYDDDLVGSEREDFALPSQFIGGSPILTASETRSSLFASSAAAFRPVLALPTYDDDNELDEVDAMDLDDDYEDVASSTSMREGPFAPLGPHPPRASTAPAPVFYSADAAAAPSTAETATSLWERGALNASGGSSGFAASPLAFGISRPVAVAAPARTPIFGAASTSGITPAPLPAVAPGALFPPARGFRFVSTSTAFGPRV
ncbi:hypothetical protein JCM9279_001825 [Rhodotorula babjevae]